MAYYLVQAAYTSDAWATQASYPLNITDRLRPLVEGQGGRVESFLYVFGEYDVVAIVQAPDNVSAAALSVAVSGGGAVKADHAPHDCTRGCGGHEKGWQSRIPATL